MSELIDIQSIILEYILAHGWRDHNNFVNLLSQEMIKNKPKDKKEIEAIIIQTKTNFFQYNGVIKRKFSEYFPAEEIIKTLEKEPLKGIIKILFLASNPMDSDPLKLDEESRAIDQAIRSSDLRDSIEIEQRWAVRVTDLQASLLRYRPTIVHFSGHGSEDSEIILGDKNGEAVAVPPAALANLFKIVQNEVKIVVLNACYSQDQAEAIAEHIEYVIGMSESIQDDAAIAFATSFYQALGYGESVEKAFEYARNQIELENIPQADIPILISKKRGAKKSVKA